MQTNRRKDYATTEDDDDDLFEFVKNWDIRVFTNIYSTLNCIIVLSQALNLQFCELVRDLSQHWLKH